MLKGNLNVTIKEINLALTLQSGQAFRWRKRSARNNVWFGIIENYVFDLEQSENGSIEWSLLNNDLSRKTKLNRKRQKITLDKNDLEDVLNDYFQLKYSLEKLYKHWSSVDEHFSSIAQRYQGVRVLRQNPLENVFSFICSSNNNIKRISKMVNSLCEEYGDYLYTDKEFGDVHAFPSAENISGNDVEQRLRELGFGYRAKYIALSAKLISEKNFETNRDWLKSLRELSYEEAHKQLESLSGIGAKVADCICLMSLDHSNAIPVDTHVKQIACRHYLPHLQKSKSLNKQIYKEIGDFFRDHFQLHAGWAHSVLFSADLKLNP